MTAKTAAPQNPRQESKLDTSNLDTSNLDARYGKIGIPAVAAAIAYQSDAKNQAYAPVDHNTESWLTEREAA